MSPWLWERRGDPGLAGFIARWWGGRRVRTVVRLRERRASVPGEPYRGRHEQRRQGRALGRALQRR